MFASVEVGIGLSILQSWPATPIQLRKSQTATVECLVRRADQVLVSLCVVSGAEGAFNRLVYCETSKVHRSRKAHQRVISDRLVLLLRQIRSHTVAYAEQTTVIR